MRRDPRARPYSGPAEELPTGGLGAALLDYAHESWEYGGLAERDALQSGRSVSVRFRAAVALRDCGRNGREAEPPNMAESGMAVLGTSSREADSTGAGGRPAASAAAIPAGRHASTHAHNNAVPPLTPPDPRRIVGTNAWTSP